MSPDAPAEPDPTKPWELVALGTAAGPRPSRGRAGIATLLRRPGRAVLVDAGRGVVDRLAQSGTDVGDLTDVVVTHLHSDHVIDLFSILLLSWGSPGEPGALGHPVRIWGPVGTAALLDRCTEAFGYDIEVRTRDTGRPDFDALRDVREVVVPSAGYPDEDVGVASVQPWVLHEDEELRISVTLVDHPPVRPSLGYRVDTPTSSVAFSGDTTACPGSSTVAGSNLVRLARGVDVLVHEAVRLEAYRGRGITEARLAHLARSHTDAADAGRVARACGARMLVLSHLAPGSVDAVSDEEWRAPAASTFGGEVLVGRDLMRVSLQPG